MITANTFAEACYEMNSTAELESALQGDADKVDLRNWGITAEEWREQIELALAEKLTHTATQ